MSVLFAFPDQVTLAKTLVAQSSDTIGDWEWRRFPDGESYVRVISDVRGKQVVILCSLYQPDEKAMALIFLAQALRENGATKITLVAPYLGYMRQDAVFKSGEAVSSSIFAKLLSPYIDALLTIDPHLHRHTRLEEIYSCACTNLNATSLMAQWLKDNAKNPLLIGPDVESEQWVSTLASAAHAPYIILTKERHGDHEVTISLPQGQFFTNTLPVIIDDIISTAGTMLKTIELLRRQGCGPVMCLATHGIFADQGYENLIKLGQVSVATTNTIPHISNKIDVAPLIAGNIR